MQSLWSHDSSKEMSNGDAKQQQQMSSPATAGAAMMMTWELRVENYTE